MLIMLKIYLTKVFLHDTIYSQEINIFIITFILLKRRIIMLKFKKILSGVLAVMSVLTIAPCTAQAQTITSVRGDFNGDRVVSSTDLFLISSFLTGKFASTKQAQFDVGGDNAITYADMDAVASMVVNSSNTGTITYDTNEITRKSVIYTKYDMLTGKTSNYTIAVNENFPASTREVISEHPLQPVTEHDKRFIIFQCGATGCIIGDHLIATCRHAVAGYTTQSQLNARVVDCGGDGTPEATLTVTSVHYPDIGTYGKDRIHDYALVVVQEDLSQYGVFNPGVTTNTFESQNSDLTVMGWRCNEVQKKYNINAFFIKCSGKALPTTPEMIYYALSTHCGESGAPVLYNDTPVGIHTGGNKTYNHGVRIDSQILNFYFNNENI